MSDGAASGTKLKEENPLIVVVEVADSSPLEPVTGGRIVVVVEEQRLVEIAGAESVGVDDAVEEVRRILLAACDEADDDDAVGAREGGRWRVIGEIR